MEEKIETKEQSESRSQKRWLIWGIIFIIIALGATFLWWLFLRPSQGMIQAVAVPEKTDLSTPGQASYQGKYFTFRYASDFSIRDEGNSVKHPLLERIYLSRNDIEGRKIAIILQDNSGNAFEEYSSFRIRRTDRDVYREEQGKRNGLSVTFFTKETRVYEVGAFFSRGNQVVSMVVSSPTTVKGLREEVEALLDSFQWKENESSTR